MWFFENFRIFKEEIEDNINKRKKILRSDKEENMVKMSLLNFV